MTLPLNLLLVDDSATDAQLFDRAARKTGFDIRLKSLAAGSEAIDYLQAKGTYADRSQYPLPDLIVLDLKMPGLNGFDFLAWRKASYVFQSIPVVILSGSDSEADVKRVTELGADRYIIKPLHPKDWKSVVQEIYDFATDGSAPAAKDSDHNLAAEPEPRQTHPTTPPGWETGRWLVEKKSLSSDPKPL